MNTSDRFEEMLAAYPADKRDLARQVCCRFADGDSTEFFTQLFLVLDVYAHYYNRIPQAVIEANQSAQANLAKLRDEINLLAQAMDRRNVNITNQAERTDELCQQAIEACDGTLAKMDGLVKNIGAQVDTAAIVKKLEEGVKGIFLPIHVRANDVAHTISPMIERMNTAAERAAKLWPKRIWQMALTAGVIAGLSISTLAISFSYWKIKRHYDTALVEQIVSEAGTLKENQKAFIALGILNLPIHVARSTDSGGHPLPDTYCIYIDGAQEADMAGQAGRVFFESRRSEKELQQLLTDTQARQGYLIMDQ